MDAVSYANSAKQAQRIKKFIQNPDSTSGILTQPSVIQTGETVSIPAGRTAVMANTVIDGTVTLDGTIFIPTGSSVDFSNGIKVNGSNIALSIPTSYNLLEGNLSVSNEVITNGFGTTLYTGNGATQSINTGIDMATQWGNDISETFGGLVWKKGRSNLNNNVLEDTVRGVGNSIYTDSTSAQVSSPTNLTSFNDNGFSIGSNGIINTNLATYASWNFQTTHRRTGVTNHGKAFTEYYNPFTGFTIIKYEGSGIAGHEIPHSLGRKLGITIIKDLSAAVNWWVNTDSGYMALNTTDLNTSFPNESNDNNIVLNSSTGFRNTSTNQYIMYGWTNSYFDGTNKLIGNYEVGVYQGTGVAGNKVKTRGKPAWVLTKRLDATSNWNLHDNLRLTNANGVLYPNGSGVESSIEWLDFNSNGFTLTNTSPENNASGGQYLYMVVYDNDSGSGKSKYPKATDTSNVQINNAIIPLAHGVDSNGSKNSIVIANETITGLTYTQGKNYLYKTDTGYGVKSYEPRSLSSELVRRFAGEQPDYYDVDKNKWFNTDAGTELVTNVTFDSNTSGWLPSGSQVLSVVSGTLKVTNSSSIYEYGGAKQTISTVIGSKYRIIAKVSALVASSSARCDYSVGSTPAGAVSTYPVGSTIDIVFTAQATSTVVIFGTSDNGINNSASFDNISVFASDITPTTEIAESRNYLNHIVHADANGQVAYVEELPKIEYKDIIKANEYRGKNACTALIRANTGTIPITIRESYGIDGIVRLSSGVYEIYLSEEVDINKIIISGTTSFTGASVTPDLASSTRKKIRVITYRSDHLGNFGGGDGELSIHIDGGKN